MTEAEVLRQILLTLGALPQLKVWRNNTGMAWNGIKVTLAPGLALTDVSGRSFTVQKGDILIRNAHPVQFGLKGSGDIAGILAPSGKALFIEVKNGHYQQTEQQKKFADMVRQMGGIYILATSPEKVEEQINQALKEAAYANDTKHKTNEHPGSAKILFNAGQNQNRRGRDQAQNDFGGTKSGEK